MEFQNLEYSAKKNRIRTQGIAYCLRHLQPFKVNIKIRKNMYVETRFEFSTHVFTRQWHERLSLDFKITDKTNADINYHDYRCFCTERYELSKKLPQILKAFKKNTTLLYNDSSKSFFIIDNDYHIFLNIYRSNNKVICRVKSAYIKRNSQHGNPREFGNYIMDKGFK